MARPYRLQAENCLYHITSRGDDRKKIFLRDSDHSRFLEYVVTAKEKFKFYLYAYCLMGNHYHLLLETTQPNISKIMQYINTSYTVYYNVKHKHCGHLFQGRYKSILVEADSYLLELTRYIHLNPTRAKIVKSPEQYQWSSYQEYIREVKDGIIDKIQSERYFKLSPAKYKEFVKEGMEKAVSPFGELYAGFILGKEKFIKDTLDILKDRLEGEEIAHKKQIQGIVPEEIIQKVAAYYKKAPKELQKAKKKPLLARKVAVYLLKRLTSLTNKAIGNEFNISYSAVSKISQDLERLIGTDRGVKNAISELSSHLKV